MFFISKFVNVAQFFFVKQLRLRFNLKLNIRKE